MAANEGSLAVKTPQTETQESLPEDVFQERPAAKVTPRAALLGLAVALLICAITPYNDQYIGATYLSGNFFPIGALGAILLIVLLINPVLMRLGKARAVFTPAEIMTVWAMIIVAVGIPSSGLMRYLIPHLAAPLYYADAANGWSALLISHLPSRLLVTDPQAVRGFFEGNRHGQPIPWEAWSTPLLWWGMFVACMFLAFFCLSALLRKQWVEHEHFAFPLVKLPVLLAEAPEPGHALNRLLRSGLVWIGVGVVTVLHTINGVHQLYPSIPAIPTQWNSGDYLTNRPWNSLSIIVALYPLAIGFSYLLASEVCLSLWMFYLIFKAQVILGILYSWDMAGTSAGYSQGPAFVSNQEAGGAVALTLWTLWTMRAHLRAVWRKAIYGARDVDDTREPLSYRFALFGLAAAYVGMFCWLSFAAGMQTNMVLGVLVGSIIIFIMMSWLVSQAGVLFMQQTFAPSELMTMLGGGAGFDARSLTVASMVEQVGWRDARELMMPSLLNSYKGATETGLSARSLTGWLALSVCLATLVSAAASIWLPYAHRGGTGLSNSWTYIDAPHRTLAWAAGQVQAPRPFQSAALLNMAAGLMFVLTLFACRSAFPWFSLHPAGFLVAASYPMMTLWFSLMIGWLAKVLIVRYGGMRGYRQALPLFMGLILGDCVNALIWVIVGLATGHGYKLLPG